MTLTPPDPAVAEVATELLRLVGGVAAAEDFFARIIRRSIDEVLDGPRTGRYVFTQLEKVERTYIGQKVEIILRDALELGRGTTLDLLVAGHDVDAKWSQGRSWMIPGEYMDPARNPLPPVCLMLGTDRAGGSLFDVIVARPLNATGKNQDGKASLSTRGLGTQESWSAQWLVRDGTLPPNFLSTLDAEAVTRIMTTKKGRARVHQLLEETIGQVVPREAIETIAQQKDAMRCIRQDSAQNMSFKVLSGDRKAGREAAALLGYGTLGRGELLPVRLADLTALPAPVALAVKKEEGL